MKISQFEYHLPLERIAHSPTSPRDEAKLLMLNRNTNEISHKQFSDLPDILTSNDVLVFNDTKVIPARLAGKKSTGGLVEIFLVTKVSDDTWECLHRGKLLVGQTVYFDSVQAVIISKSEQMITLKFDKAGSELDSFIDIHGSIPLPPYIHSPESEAVRREEYQTVYAQAEGSIASPTAGLHFTNELIEKLTKKGIQIEYITLHVGLGTFLPIKETDITKHKMHSEHYILSSETATRLNEAKKNGKSIIAVGTTTTRVLESQFKTNELVAGHGSTDIFIYPPYKFLFLDGLITNFHLPHSTLLSLVSAFVSEPNTSHKFTSFQESGVGMAYTEAIQNDYRFYSFGDGMFIS